MRLINWILWLAVMSIAMTGVVSAEEASDGVTDRMTVPKGTIRIDAFLEVNLSADSAFKPTSLAPDVWYGINDDLSVGLVHSGMGIGGFWAAAGNGLCFTGEDNGCAKIYDNLALLSRFHLLDGAVVLAGEGGLLINSLDPFTLGVKLGVTGRWQSGALSVIFAPSINIGITERDNGNKEILGVPVSVVYAATDSLGVGLQTGIVLPFDNTGELWRLPLSVGATFGINDKLSVGGAFSLIALAGGDLLPDAFDGRTFTLTAGYTL